MARAAPLLAVANVLAAPRDEEHAEEACERTDSVLDAVPPHGERGDACRWWR